MTADRPNRGPKPKDSGHASFDRDQPRPHAIRCPVLQVDEANPVSGDTRNAIISRRPTRWSGFGKGMKHSRTDLLAKFGKISVTAL
jgi:hypothetical protein